MPSQAPALQASFAARVDTSYLPLTPRTTHTYEAKLDGQSGTDVVWVTVVGGDDVFALVSVKPS